MNMENEVTDLKEDDSFEILPHLSEDDIFMETQKYRFLKKYTDELTSETNSLSSSNVWSISGTEFYDLTNSIYSEPESNMRSCPDEEKSSNEIETLRSDSFSREIVPYGEFSFLGDHEFQTTATPVNSLELINNKLKYCSVTEKSINEDSQLHLEFNLNNEAFVDIVPHKITKTVLDDACRTVSKNTLPSVEAGVAAVNKSNVGSSGNETNERSVIASEGTEHIRAAVQVYRGRSKSSKRICEVVNNGLNFCKWCQRNRIIRTVLDSAKFSFNSFVNLFELELNRMIGVDEKGIHVTIVSEESNFRAIKEAFSSAFHNHVSVSWVLPEQNSTPGPVLPVGHLAGVHNAEAKIHSARQIDGDSTLISTSTLLYEAIPQRWQMATVICLDDPKIHLQLHNFTVSTPIPNEYVTEMESKTPYPMRDSGFALTLEQAASNLTSVMVKDIQKFLAGLDCCTTLKSAALVLAGMYKKYL